MYFIIDEVPRSGHGGRWNDKVIRSFNTKEELLKYLTGIATTKVKVFQATEMKYETSLKLIPIEGAKGADYSDLPYR